MSRVRAPDRKESPFEVRDYAMFQLVKTIHELDYVRNFGLKIRFAKYPKNWEKWSEDSKAAWMLREAERIERLRILDMRYLRDARVRVQRALDDLLFHIAKANRYRRPKTIESANARLNHQIEAAGACDALRIPAAEVPAAGKRRGGNEDPAEDGDAVPKTDAENEEACRRREIHAGVRGERREKLAVCQAGRDELSTGAEN